MRKYRHTALVVLAVVACLASPARAQFSEIWTNGELFKVNDMASQCYSASVERCVAVGVTPDSPSWWDYLLGKNHAKLVSVKSNIVACAPYYAPPDQYFATNFNTFTALTLQQHAGLPTNSLDETPYFKSQYPGTTGGWHAAWRLLTNLTTVVDANVEWPSSNCVQVVWYDLAPFETNSYAYQPFASNWVDYALATGTGGPSARVTSDHYWETNKTAMSPWQFEFSGEVYVLGESVWDVFDSQGDNIEIGYQQCLAWTNAVNQQYSPQFRISTNTYVIPPNYNPTNEFEQWGYYVDPWFYYAVYRMTATTNGFKYR